MITKLNNWLPYYLTKRNGIVTGEISPIALNFYSITQIVVLLLISILILHSSIQQMLYYEHKIDFRLTKTKSYQYSVIIYYSLSNKELPHYFYSNAFTSRIKRADYLYLSPVSFRICIISINIQSLWFFNLMSIWATLTINRTYTHISAYQRHDWFIWIFSTILHSSTWQTSRFFSPSERLLRQRPEIYFLLR